MNKTKIEWCDYTWNPIVGCKRNCSYCYARRIWERFNPDLEFNVIRCYPERLEDKMPKKPAKIFVGSMSDIAYWNTSDLEKILKVCEDNPQHTFMFLSKDPKAYMRPLYYPKNTMQGLTIEAIEDDKDIELVRQVTRFPRPYLSLEPLMGFVHHFLPPGLELVIVGAMTGPRATAPKQEWIKSVKTNIPEAKLFWKSNIKKFNQE